MKLYFIAGESSGDFIGAKVIKSIKISEVQRKNISFHGIGGLEMAGEGIHSLFDFQQINLMGFFEVLPHIIHIKKLIDDTVEDIITKAVDVLVTIDSPGFTFRVAEKVKILAPTIKLVHIVAPSVWAYNEGRSKKYARIYDKLLTLFPFEPPYFTKYGLSCEYIGHPILEQDFHIKSQELKDEKIIAITPGSRKGEISRHMPIIRGVLDRLSSMHKIQAIFVQPNDVHINYILTYLKNAKFEFTFSTDKLKSFSISDVALAKSGTNTLEIAASGTAIIVGYKLNILTYMLLKMVIKIKYASIINIIANKEIIPEYLQSDFTVDNLVNALNELLFNPAEAAMQVRKTRAILKTIGLGSKDSPSKKAAKAIIGMVKRRHSSP